jgi:micrococcal nuclease
MGIKGSKIKEKKSELNKCSIKTPLFTFDDENHMCKIVKCYDGDTVHCIFKHNKKYQRFKIRMYGYNTPELRDKDPIIKANAYKAKARITDLLLNKIVYIQCKGFDKYGRVLGIIKINKTDPLTVNQLMVNEGHGVVYMI